jgi:GT2 family glycosyltransferase
MPLSALRAAGARYRRKSTLNPAAGVRLPLSALRARLDQASAGADWRLHPDGVLGRVLLMDAGATVTFPLELVGEVSFSARAMLLPHDWRDRRGRVRASVAVTDRQGGRRELWSGTLRASDRGRPRGRRVHCPIPACSRALELKLDAHGALRPGSVARAVWVEPAITDPHAPPIPSPPARSAPSPQPPSNTPLISVLTPIHDPPPHMLEQAIASVRAQTFTNWELCLVDDGSSDLEIIAALQRHAASDPRIHLQRRPTAGGISTATNTALELATGHYIALLDHDDTLTPDALQHVADQIATQPDLDMIYTDEDVVDDRGLIERHPKPGWSPEHMSALMYTCHLGVYRRALAVDVGGFETRFDGCQDYDFVLRLVERTDRIAHIPRILYHWRAHASSTAGGDQAKPHAYLAQPGAISDHLRRSHIDAEVQFGQVPGLHRVVHRVDPCTSVDLVLAVEDEQGLSEAAFSWLAQPHPTWNVVLAAPAHTLDAATAALTTAGIPSSRITTIPTEPSARLASALTAAANAANAEHLLLMQTPAIGLTHDWLTRLIGYSQQPQIAAAGPILLAPDGRIQQAGIAIPDGIPLHLHHGSRATAALPVVYNLSAVSGVLATRRDTYQQLGGLNPELEDLALIDYCLRATDHRQRIVIVPDARLRTTGPDHTTNDLPAIWRLRHTWAQTHTGDPYYNPNYRTDRGDFILRL